MLLHALMHRGPSGAVGDEHYQAAGRAELWGTVRATAVVPVG
jgi:hypothetical protein